MKKTAAAVFLAVAAAVVYAKDAEPGAASIVDARVRIGEVIENPALMTDVIKSLSAADQATFLADVNKAIGEMPASVEEKAAKYLNVNHAALKGAKKGNVATLLSEVFATVSPDALVVINERFAADVVNRSADPAVNYTDEQFTKIAVELMNKINARTAETDNPSVRSAFAILMLVRASNGSPADLADKLIETMPSEEGRELAKTEWVPSALGADGRTQSYEPMLASADVGRRPDLDFVLVVAGPQHLDALLADLLGKDGDPVAQINARTPVFDAITNVLMYQIPMLGTDAVEEEAMGILGGDVPAPKPPEPSPGPGPGPRPGPYPGQSTLGG
ncbi:MAG: hypothetical protein J6T01_06095 [Kiritimatiellae bacterium]|nr:hypothetical protein [Kiritimatiellia bacterium]